MLCNNHFYLLLPLVFHLFLLQKDFNIFQVHIFAFFFLAKILIPFISFFSKLSFVFLIASGQHFYICEKNYLIDYTLYITKITNKITTNTKILHSLILYIRIFFITIFCIRFIKRNFYL